MPSCIHVCSNYKSNESCNISSETLNTSKAAFLNAITNFHCVHIKVFIDFVSSFSSSALCQFCQAPLFLSLSSHLCISSFCRLAPSPPSMVTSPPLPAARSTDRLARSWFNNYFVTLCLCVLQWSRL